MVLTPFAALAAEEAKPAAQMGMMRMVLLSRAEGQPTAAPRVSDASAQRRHVESLLTSGTLAFVGDTTGDGALRSVLISRSAETNAARDLVADLPVVKSGTWQADTLGWYGPTNHFQPISSVGGRGTYFFGLLLSGTNAAALPGEELKQIQEGHMANIRRLAELGKLVIAGPFVGGGNRRGIFIFKVDSLAEAQRLTDTDPAVQAGRLRIELHPIEVPTGILP